MVTHDGWVVPAYKVESICNGDSTTFILVKFVEPLFYNSFAKVAILKGSNGNYIKTTCGVEWKNDSIDVKVQNCYNAQLSLNSLNRTSFDTVQINWIADTSTFPTYLFTGYNIYRKTALDTSFVFIGTKTNLMAQSFSDGKLPVNYFGIISYYVAISVHHKALQQTDTLSLLVRHKATPSIFPLPAKDFINIYLTGDGANKVDVFDMNGRIVYSKETQQNLVSIPVSLWKSGMYVVVVSGNNTLVKKVIVY